MNWFIFALAILTIIVLIVYEEVWFDNTVNALLAAAARRPYFHLYHGDGSLYMERFWIVPFASDKEGCFTATWRQPIFWLLQKLGVAIRLHIIHTPDLDRALHDHPWTFLRWVLRGWYVEERPVTPDTASFDADEREAITSSLCEKRSWALRRFYERHRIAAVSPDGVVTLFISFKKRQSWGFFTPQGKIWSWVFESVHNHKAITAAKPFVKHEGDLYVGD